MTEDQIKETFDGLPIPPGELRYLVSGNANDTESSFFDMGRHCAQRIIKSLRKIGVEMKEFDAILDFGCGCGRTIRHFRTLNSTKLYGSDYNPKLIDWCRKNLPIASFAVNQLHPPLPYADEAFGLVYAFSVFTHLPEPLQLSWMKELSRVIKSNGYLVISTLPMRMLANGQRTDQLVVCNESQAGENSCLAYHAGNYVKEKLARGFDVIEFIEGQTGQDFYLLRKIREGGP